MAYQPVQVHLPAPAQLQDPMELRKLRQTQLLNRAWNDSLVTAPDPNNPKARIGDVDQRKFYASAAALGLDPDSAAASLAWRQKQYQNVSGMSDIADTMAAKRPGFNIEEAVGRAGTGYGAPAVIDNTPVPPQGVAGMSGSIGQTVAGAAAEQPKPQAPVTPQGVAVPPPEPQQTQTAPAAPRTGWDGVSDYLGIGRKPEQMLAAQGYPQPQPQTDVPRPAGVPDTSMLVSPMPDIPEADMQMYRDQVQVPPDTRTFDEAALDQYMSLPFGGAQTSSAQMDPAERAKDPVFAWAPQDDGSNAYRQYATALDSQLKANGFASAPDYLMSVYDSAYSQYVKPVPPAALMATPEGKIKYQTMMAEHQQSKVEADARARQAVLAERKALTEDAQKYGVSTIDQRKTEMPEGYVLRDPSKRNEAAALSTNRQNARYAADAVNAAGTDTVKLGLALPQVVRAYATALNPSQQLSEGNIREVAAQMYPEHTGSKEFMLAAALAVGRFFRNGDTSGISQLTNTVDASDPKAVQARLARLAQEAQHLTEVNLRNYVVPAKADAKKPTDKWFEGAQAESRAKKQPAADTAAAPKAPAKPAPAPAPKKKAQPKTSAKFSAMTPEQQAAKIASLKARGLL